MDDVVVEEGNRIPLGEIADALLECSPKVDPGVMRVCGAEAPLTSNETKET
jgi:hypothetical protein